MIAEIISIGDELTSGQRLDTNSQWISQQLVDLGIRPMFHTTIADDLASNRQAFQIASERAEIVIASGGLGPTDDDLTRQAVAEAFELNLIEDADALAHIQSLFAARQRPMPERNRVQALRPDGSLIVPNPHGTAPGFDLSVTNSKSLRSRIFTLPGVPAEMRQMFDETVRPRLLKQFANSIRLIEFRTLRCFGLGESEVELRFPGLIHRDRVPKVGITVSRATISLRIVAEGNTKQQCEQQLQQTASEIRERLGNFVFGEGNDELSDVVLRAIREQNSSLATAEIGNNSLLDSWLSLSHENRDNVYLGNLHAGNESIARERFLSEAFKNADSETTYRQLAERVREQFGSQWSLVVGPYADLSNPQVATQVQPLWIAISGPSGTTSRSFPMSGHPDVIHARSAKLALDDLRYQLLKLERPK